MASKKTINQKFKVNEREFLLRLKTEVDRYYQLKDFCKANKLNKDTVRRILCGEVDLSKARFGTVYKIASIINYKIKF
jgi:hypothetical protein